MEEAQMQESLVSGVFSVGFPHELAMAWGQFCLDNGRDPGAVLRVALRNYLAAKAGDNQDATTV